MSRSRSRERHVTRYKSRTDRRGSRSRYDCKNNKLYDDFYYRNDDERNKNRFCLTSYHHYSYASNHNYTQNHAHYHQHQHQHNHAHHHYHHHHYNIHNNKFNNNKSRNVSRNRRMRTQIRTRNRSNSGSRNRSSSGFSEISDDDGGDDDNCHSDFEGSVNLKNIDCIYRDRYSIGKKLGRGTFGLVMECIDNKRKIRVAVKIIRSVKRYLDAAEIEVDILNKLDEFDLGKNSLIIRLYKSFKCDISCTQHCCLIFEKCGHSLYDYIKKNKHCGFPSDIIAVIGYQLMHSIGFCHEHELTHTDLKLENILFVSDSYYRDSRSALYLPRNSFEIRLIDFGGATFESDHHSSIINTRQYRGPEVILKLKWSFPSDVWSAGCILAELYCGELLFATHDDAEHLQLMQKILNIEQFPPHMISPQNEYLFNQKTKQYIHKTKQLKHSINDDKLCDLITECLRIDPNKRITAKDAKKHPFFMQFKDENNYKFNEIYELINNDKK